MSEILAITGLTAAAFAATNVDNLLLLVSWLLEGRLPVSKIFAGYFLGVLALLGVSLLVGLLSYVVPVSYLGVLGLVPITLGVKALLENFRRQEVVGTAGVGAAAVLSISATQLANGVDTALVFSPLLADSRSGVDVLIAGSFLLMAVVWFGLARALTHHAARIPLVQTLGRWLGPAVMIVIGIYILDNTATDLLAGD